MKNILINLKNSIVDRFRRKAIIKTALEHGCDIDGDIICYKGIYYVIYILDDIIYRSAHNEKGGIEKWLLLKK